MFALEMKILQLLIEPYFMRYTFKNATIYKIETMIFQRNW